MRMGTSLFKKKNKDEAEVIEYLEDSYEFAEELLKDPDQVEELLQKLENKLKGVPIAGGFLSYIPILISAVRMHIKKEYKDIPIASITAIVAGLLYWINPLDIIPDFIPGAGQFDDAAVIAGIIYLCKTDLKDYVAWRKKKGMIVQDLPNYDSSSIEANGLFRIVMAFFTGKKFKK